MCNSAVLSVYLWTSTKALVEASLSFFSTLWRCFQKCPQPNYYKHISLNKYFPDYPLLMCCLLVLMLQFSYYPFRLWQLHNSCNLWKDTIIVSNKMLCTTQMLKKKKKCDCVLGSWYVTQETVPWHKSYPERWGEACGIRGSSGRWNDRVLRCLCILAAQWLLTWQQSSPDSLWLLGVSKPRAPGHSLEKKRKELGEREKVRKRGMEACIPVWQSKSLQNSFPKFRHRTCPQHYTNIA